MQCASMSSGRVKLKVPRKDLANPVLTLSTITTSRICALQNSLIIMACFQEGLFCTYMIGSYKS